MVPSLALKPEPASDESRDDFMERCVPQVSEDGAASSSEQAVAICSSLWDRKDFSEEDHPRDDAGRFAPAGGGGAGSGPGAGGEGGSGSGRAERAQRTHKPSTAEKQRRGDSEQARLATSIGGESTEDNLAFDVLLGRHAIEVKTVIDNDNDKITVHPKSRERKLTVARKEKLKPHTVAIDVRSGRREYYYRSGVGAFRLGNMERVSLRDLRERFA